MRKLIIPPKLKQGDTIGFISPSAGLAPFAMHRIEKAKKTFEKLGYKIKIARHALKNSGYVSASIEERVSDIHEMFSDLGVKLIMTTIGGNHSNQLLKYIDYELIKKNPKIFIGYSDITVLHLAFYSKADLATYYGPCVMTQFGENPEVLEYTLKYFLKAVSEEKSERSYLVEPSNLWTEEILDWFKKKDLKKARKLEKNKGYQWLIKGSAKGKIFGGCIPSINHLAGTGYWNNPKNTIFFIDIPEGEKFDQGLSIDKVDSYLADLDNLGVFDSIAGLIIGRPFHYSKEDEIKLKEIILRYLKKRKCPTLYNVNIGHADPIITLRYGAIAELDSVSDLFRIVSAKEFTAETTDE